MEKSTEEDQFYFLGFLILFLAAFFYLYEFFLRVFISTISYEIMEEMRLNAQSFSIMGASYCLIYNSMQLPVGVLANKFTVRFLLVSAVLISALGGFCFAFAQGFASAFVCRALMGFGSSFGYVCLLILALNWFPRKHFGSIIGVVNLFGAMGPILAGGPFVYLLQQFHHDWRLILQGMGICGFLLAFFIGFIVQDRPRKNVREMIFLEFSQDSLKTQLKWLFCSFQVLSITLYTGFVYVCLPLLGTYWGTAYLQSKGITQAHAAFLSSILWVGLAIGSIALGRLSDTSKKRRPFLCGCAFLGVVVSSLVVLYPTGNAYVYGLLFFFIGVASSGASIAYATITESVPKKFHAGAIGMNNTLFFIPVIIPPLFSFFIHKAARAHSYLVSAPMYTTQNFQAGLMFMPFLYGFAFILALFFIKETFCRQQEELIRVSVH